MTFRKCFRYGKSSQFDLFARAACVSVSISLSHSLSPRCRPYLCEKKMMFSISHEYCRNIELIELLSVFFFTDSIRIIMGPLYISDSTNRQRHGEIAEEGERNKDPLFSQWGRRKSSRETKKNCEKHGKRTERMTEIADINLVLKTELSFE